MCVYVYICAVLEIGAIASQNANHFMGNCESLCQSKSQNRQSLLTDFANHFSTGIAKKTFFYTKFPLF